MNWSSALPAAVALGSAAILVRRQMVWKLGAYGRAVAAPFLLIVWFVFLSIGRFWGSLVPMAWTAAAPLVAVAGIGVVRFKACRLKPLRWTDRKSVV